MSERNRLTRIDRAAAQIQPNQKRTATVQARQNVTEVARIEANGCQSLVPSSSCDTYEMDPTLDPLVAWPSMAEFTALFPTVKMLLQIPASSAENERSFSSACFILDQRYFLDWISKPRRRQRVPGVS